MDIRYGKNIVNKNIVKDKGEAQFIWHGASHQVEVAALPIDSERRYVGWFDRTIGEGFAFDKKSAVGEAMTIEELVKDWEEAMRKRG